MHFIWLSPDRQDSRRPYLPQHELQSIAVTATTDSPLMSSQVKSRPCSLFLFAQLDVAAIAVRWTKLKGGSASLRQPP